MNIEQHSPQTKSAPTDLPFQVSQDPAPRSGSLFQSLRDLFLPPAEEVEIPEPPEITDQLIELLQKTACGFSYLAILHHTQGDLIEINERDFNQTVTKEIILRIPRLRDEYTALTARETSMDRFLSWFGASLESKSYIAKMSPIGEAVQELMDARLVGENRSVGMVNSMAPGLSYGILCRSIGISASGLALINSLSADQD